MAILEGIRVFICSLLREPTYVADAVFTHKLTLPKNYWRFTLLKPILGTNVDLWPGFWTKNFCPLFWITNFAAVLWIFAGPILLVLALIFAAVEYWIVPAANFIVEALKEKPEQRYKRWQRRIRNYTPVTIPADVLSKSDNPKAFIKSVASLSHTWTNYMHPRDRYLYTMANLTELLRASGCNIWFTCDSLLDLLKAENPKEALATYVEAVALEAMARTFILPTAPDVYPAEIKLGDKREKLTWTIYQESLQKIKEVIANALAETGFYADEKGFYWDLSKVDLNKFHAGKTLDPWRGEYSRILGMFAWGETLENKLIDFNRLRREVAEIRDSEKEKEKLAKEKTKLEEEKKAAADEARKKIIAARSAKMAKALPYLKLTCRWLVIVLSLTVVTLGLWFFAIPTLKGIVLLATAIWSGLVWCVGLISLDGILRVLGYTAMYLGGFSVLCAIAYFFSDVLLEVVTFLEKMFPEKFVEAVNDNVRYQRVERGYSKFFSFIFGVFMEVVCRVCYVISRPFVIAFDWCTLPFSLIAMALKNNCPGITLEDDDTTEDEVPIDGK